jgi:ribosomal protein S27AE
MGDTEKPGSEQTPVVGKRAEELEESEAGGREKKYLLYTCFNCGAGSYISPGQTNFSCWRCGSHNASDDP